MVATLVMLGSVSVVGMAVEKVLYECQKPNHAQYISLATSAFIGLTALQGVFTLLKFIGTF